MPDASLIYSIAHYNFAEKVKIRLSSPKPIGGEQRRNKSDRLQVLMIQGNSINCHADKHSQRHFLRCHSRTYLHIPVRQF
jgi:hypothetical protein